MMYDECLDMLVMNKTERKSTTLPVL